MVSNMDETVCFSMLKTLEIEDSIMDADEQVSLEECLDEEMSTLPEEWTKDLNKVDSGKGLTETTIVINLEEQEKNDDKVVSIEKEAGIQDKVISLPKEWVYNCSEPEGLEKAEVLVVKTMEDMQDPEKALTDIVQNRDQSKIVADANKENRVPAVKKRTKKWGPMMPVRRCKRHPPHGMTMLEKAQALKE